MVKMRKIFISFLILLCLSFFLAFSSDTGELKAAKNNIVIFRPESNVIYHIIVVKPDPNIDAKILVAEPDPNIDAKILVAEPDHTIDREILVIDPTQMKSFSQQGIHIIPSQRPGTRGTSCIYPQFYRVEFDLSNHWN